MEFEPFEQFEHQQYRVQYHLDEKAVPFARVLQMPLMPQQPRLCLVLHHFVGPLEARELLAAARFAGIVS